MEHLERRRTPGSSTTYTDSTAKRTRIVVSLVNVKSTGETPSTRKKKKKKRNRIKRQGRSVGAGVTGGGHCDLKYLKIDSRTDIKKRKKKGTKKKTRPAQLLRVAFTDRRSIRRPHATPSTVYP